MCGIRQWDAKTRRLYAAGMVFLLTGMTLARFVGAPWCMLHRGLYDGLRGLCAGLAMGLFLCVIWRKRRCGPALREDRGLQPPL
jgi:hypothetical protein